TLFELRQTGTPWVGEYRPPRRARLNPVNRLPVPFTAHSHSLFCVECRPFRALPFYGRVRPRASALGWRISPAKAGSPERVESATGPVHVFVSLLVSVTAL